MEGQLTAVAKPIANLLKQILKPLKMNLKSFYQILLATWMCLPGILAASETAHNDLVDRSSIETSMSCQVDISSEASIQRYLERGLRTSDAGGSVLTYKTIYDWNTVGVEIKFDNGNKVSGINVRITPGNYRAKVFMDFPEIGNSGVYYLTSDGVLKSEDGTFTYLCQ